MKERYPIIGDVRGKGLMIGVELVKDSTKTPAVDETKAVRKSCLEGGLLIGTGGVWANVMRIQPPLVITDEQLDEALAIIEGALKEL
jgi:4-aminobutyrate aminotransferase-like enzyme